MEDLTSGVGNFVTSGFSVGPNIIANLGELQTTLQAMVNATNSGNSSQSAVEVLTTAAQNIATMFTAGNSSSSGSLSELLGLLQSSRVQCVRVILVACLLQLIGSRFLGRLLMIRFLQTLQGFLLKRVDLHAHIHHSFYSHQFP